MLTQIEILGFDRVGFVHEVTETVACYAQISGATFDADGVRSVGKLHLRFDNADKLNSIKQVKCTFRLIKYLSKIGLFLGDDFDSFTIYKKYTLSK